MVNTKLLFSDQAVCQTDSDCSDGKRCESKRWNNGIENVIRKTCTGKGGIISNMFDWSLSY